MRILKTLTLATAGVLTGAGLLVAPFAQTTAHAAGCTFEVRAPSAPVRENPSSASVIRKYKTVWQHVTGPCYGRSFKIRTTTTSISGPSTAAPAPTGSAGWRPRPCARCSSLGTPVGDPAPLH